MAGDSYEITGISSSWQERTPDKKVLYTAFIHEFNNEGYEDKDLCTN